jgi:hypothetical protein
MSRLMSGENPYLLLPPFQNIRRLSFSQKLTYFMFDQIYT